MYYSDSIILNHQYVSYVNHMMKKKRILQYTGSICGFVSMLYAKQNHKQPIPKNWKFFYMMLIFTSFVNHRYKTSLLLLLDRFAIIGNIIIMLKLFYKNFNHMSHSHKICFIWFFFGSIFAYLFGMATNTLCFDNRFGYVVHALCHLYISMACYIILVNN
jgi:hypothetical protein